MKILNAWAITYRFFRYFIYNILKIDNSLHNSLYFICFVTLNRLESTYSHEINLGYMVLMRVPRVLTSSPLELVAGTLTILLHGNTLTWSLGFRTSVCKVFNDSNPIGSAFFSAAVSYIVLVGVGSKLSLYSKLFVMPANSYSM